MELILASQSPRRRELLAQMGLTNFQIIPAQGEEIVPENATPAQVVKVLSQQKAQEIALQFPDAVIIGADTVVALDGKILGKPRDAQDAIQMLTALSGNTNTVYTGVTVCQGTHVLTRSVATQVTFRTLTPEEISAYVATGEPLDKAGSYGIQGLGGLLISGITGDYFNVVGLPIATLGQMLGQFGIQILK